MNFINKLERKIGKYSIQNLSLCLIICYGFGYAIHFVNPTFINFLTLNPHAIIHQFQIWRIFTWVLVPPDSFDLFTLIMLYFYYSIGTTLERTWGTFYYNLYIFSGMIFTVLGSFLLYACMSAGIAGGDYINSLGLAAGFVGVSRLFSTYYINMSIFLAFAATFPEIQVLLMFIIPIKVKWLGIVDAVFLAYNFIFAYSGVEVMINNQVATILMPPIVTRVVIASSMLSFCVFFLLTRNLSHLSPKQMKRRATYKRQVRQVAGITKHKCAICGRTEQDDPNLEFRFCSKCEGNYEYCQEHLFTHTHVHR